jgi:ubiquitin-like protein Pup
MPEQTTKKGSATKAEQPTKAAEKDLNPTRNKLAEDMDALIEEIDEVLEENAAKFVKNYVQRGGE